MGREFIFVISMDMFIMRTNVYTENEERQKVTTAKQEKISTPFVSARHSDNKKANPLFTEMK